MPSGAPAGAAATAPGAMPGRCSDRYSSPGHHRWSTASSAGGPPAFGAAKFAAGHAFKDGDKRRLFGEHLVLAGLPKQLPPLAYMLSSSARGEAGARGHRQLA
jgi:hypothetical protein